MKFIASAIVALTLSACSSESAHLTGAPHEFGPVCSSADGDVSFRIYEGRGQLREYGRNAVQFRCSEKETSGVVWQCQADDSSQNDVTVVREGGNYAAEVTLQNGSKTTLDCQ